MAAKEGAPLREWTLDDIADGMSKLPEGSRAYGTYDVELKRRQTEAIVKSAGAQKDAARYMLWTLVAILVTSGITAAATVWQAWNVH